jgi:hypothetical protein
MKNSESLAQDIADLLRLWPDRKASDDAGKRVKDLVSTLVRSVIEHRAPTCWGLFRQAEVCSSPVESLTQLCSFARAIQQYQRRPQGQTLDRRGKPIASAALAAIQSSGSHVGGRPAITDKSIGAPHAALAAQEALLKK